VATWAALMLSIVHWLSSPSGRQKPFSGAGVISSSSPLAAVLTVACLAKVWVRSVAKRRISSLSSAVVKPGRGPASGYAAVQGSAVVFAGGVPGWAVFVGGEHPVVGWVSVGGRWWDL
jgi:hypothetical protein